MAEHSWQPHNASVHPPIWPDQPCIEISGTQLAPAHLNTIVMHTELQQFNSSCTVKQSAAFSKTDNDIVVFSWAKLSTQQGTHLKAGVWALLHTHKVSKLL